MNDALTRDVVSRRPQPVGAPPLTRRTRLSSRRGAAEWRAGRLASRALHVTYSLCLRLATEYASIGSACGVKGCVRCRSGCPMCGRRSSSLKLSCQSVAIATGESEADDQAFGDAISVGLGRGRRRSVRVTRGEIYTAAARGAYSGNHDDRRHRLSGDDRFDATPSAQGLLACPFPRPVWSSTRRDQDRPRRAGRMANRPGPPERRPHGRQDHDPCRDQVWASDSDASATTNSCS